MIPRTTLPILEDAPELALAEVERVLRLLVSIPSQNGIDPEGAIAERIAAELDGLGFETKQVPLDGDDRRTSLGARLAGRGSGPALVLNGHVDTVPTGDRERWSADPFGGEVRDGALIGRGAVDMKAGLAAQLLCARALARLGPLRGTLVLHFAAGEEGGEPGTSSLLEAGFGGDLGIVTEPTGLEVATAMRGMCAYRILVTGRSAHAANVEEGLNPMSGVTALLGALERYDADLRARVTHPRLPDTRCTPTIVRGGFEQSTVPESCEVVVDRRLVPGETHETALEELQALVRDVSARHADLGWSVEPLLWFEPCEIADDHPLARSVVEAAAEVLGTAPPVVATPYGSDVTHLVHGGGMAAVQFGPGDVRLAHATDERVPLHEVRNAALTLTLTALSLLDEGEPG